MSLSYRAARDEISDAFTDAWRLANPTFPIVYEDAPAPSRSALPWARLTIRHNRGEQEAMANPLGNRLFFRDGVVTVQIFTPAGEGLTRSYDLAKVAADAFEGRATPGGVWFRSVRIREIGPDGNWYQINVVADFQYNEAK